MRGFRLRSVFGLRPNTCRHAADETKIPVAREKKTSLVPRVNNKQILNKPRSRSGGDWTDGINASLSGTTWEMEGNQPRGDYYSN